MKNRTKILFPPKKSYSGKRLATSPILVGVDFTPGSASALGQAIRIAASRKLPLTMLRAIQYSPVRGRVPLPKTWVGSLGEKEIRERPQWSALLEHERRELQRIRVPAGVKVDRVVEGNSPYLSLLSQSRRLSAQLIVLGVHKPKSVFDRKILGSTAEMVLRHAKVPVLVVRGKSASAYKRILVALDMSAISLRVLITMARLFPKAQLHAVHFSPLSKGKAFQQILKDFRVLLSEAGIESRKVKLTVLPGSPEPGILRQAERFRADLIAMGTHGRSGLKRVFLGSVAEHTLREASRDVLVVPPFDH